MTADDVADALAAIAHADDAAALDHLLAAWAGTRSASLARLIVLVDRCATGFEAVAPPATPAALLAASPLARGRLLRALAAAPGELVAADAGGWLDALRTLPPDPRVSAMLDAFSNRLPLAWTEPIGDLEDPELDLTDELTAKFRRVCEHHHDANVDDLPHGEPRLPPSRGILADEHERAITDAELVLRRRLFDDAGDRAAIAPFAADPTRRENLTAYADWLTARGDPRGALLAWGAGAAPADHALQALWLGPLGRVAYARIDDGWVKHVRFNHDHRKPEPDLDWRAIEVGWRPSWCAVEELDDPPATLVASVPLPALRILGCGTANLATAIAANADLTDLDILALYRWRGDTHAHRGDVERMQALLRAPQLRGLRQLKLHSYAADRDGIRALVRTISHLLADPCGVEMVTVHTSSRDWMWVPAPEWLAALRATSSPLRRFRGTGSAGERWIFGHASPDAVDWQAARVEWWASKPNPFTADRILEVARAGARSIVVVAKAPLAPDVLARLREAECELAIETDPTLDLDRLDR